MQTEQNHSQVRLFQKPSCEAGVIVDSKNQRWRGYCPGDDTVDQDNEISTEHRIQKCAKLPGKMAKWTWSGTKMADVILPALLSDYDLPTLLQDSTGCGSAGCRAHKISISGGSSSNMCILTHPWVFWGSQNYENHTPGDKYSASEIV
jgi:hypothetical protein